MLLIHCNIVGEVVSQLKPRHIADGWALNLSKEPVLLRYRHKKARYQITGFQIFN